MNDPKKPHLDAHLPAVEDIDLLMLYYGEHDDPHLATRVASDPTLSARMERLSLDLANIENAPLPEPDESYAQRVWQTLVPELGADREQSPVPPVVPWYQQLLQPRFSMAGLSAILAVALFAFVMGQNMSPGRGGALTLDSQALLVRELTLHLQQAEMLLTEVANSGTTDPSNSATAVASVSTAAQPLLRANRLYRVAGGAEVSPQLGQLLADMETLLLQIANASSDTDLSPLADYVDRNLLFRVRTLRNSLSDKQNSRI